MIKNGCDVRALTPEQMEILIDKYIIELYQQLEQEVIADIARRIKKTGRYTETAEIMVKSMTEQGFSADRILAGVMKTLRADPEYMAFVAQNTKEYKAFVQDEIKAAIKQAKKNGDALVSEAGNMAYNNDLSMWKQAGVDLEKPNSLSQIMDAFKKQTSDGLRNLTRTTGFKNTAFGFTPIEHLYQKELDLALLRVASGTFSFDRVVNDCVHRLAQSGLRTIDYASGRSYQLDTAARMCVRTGMSQLSGKITEANIAKTGVDLVITSQHMGSRPEHAVWQNRVFSYSGKSRKYPDFVKATGYGSVEGLKGANCAHDFFPFWEGISVIPEDLKEPPPVVVNGKEYTYYQATQRQRDMERNIRATKREIEAQKAIGGDTAELRKKLKQQTADYHGFSSAVGIRAKDNRLRVVSGTSDLNKTAAIKRQPSNVSKAISLSDVSNAAKGTDMAGEVVSEIGTVLERNNALGIYTNISFVELKDKNAKDVFQTVTTQFGNWSNSSFCVNKTMLSGKNLDEINDAFQQSQSTVCNSLEDGIIHEIYHAKLADILQFSEYNRLCNTAGMKGISPVASADLSETIAEIGVLKERGEFENLSDEAKELFKQYFEV